MSLSVLEALLALHLRAEKISYAREVVLDDLLPRRWRWDFVVGSRILIEVQGGIHMQGRHTRGAGYVNDVEKHNTAVLAGYLVLWVAPEHIRSGQAIAWIRAAWEKFPR